MKGELAEQAIMSKKNVLKQYFIVDKTNDIKLYADNRKTARKNRTPNQEKIVRVEIDLKTMQATAKVVR
jgi:hypothetical protein